MRSVGTCITYRQHISTLCYVLRDEEATKPAAEQEMEHKIEWSQILFYQIIYTHNFNMYNVMCVYIGVKNPKIELWMAPSQGMCIQPALSDGKLVSTVSYLDAYSRGSRPWEKEKEKRESLGTRLERSWLELSVGNACSSMHTDGRCSLTRRLLHRRWRWRKRWIPYWPQPWGPSLPPAYVPPLAFYHSCREERKQTMIHMVDTVDVIIVARIHASELSSKDKHY